MFERIVTIILPVVIMVLAGWLYARWKKPDMTVTNRLNMDVCVPLLVFSAMAGKDFDLARWWELLPAVLLLIFLDNLGVF